MKKLFVLLTLLLIFSCQKDDEFTNDGPSQGDGSALTDQEFAEQNFGQSISSDFIGRIINEQGNAIKDVLITINNQNTYTDHNGVFVLNDASVYENFALVKASKPGFIEGSRTLIPTTNGTNDVLITLLRINVVGSINSGINSEVTLPNGAKVAFQGDFIDSLGNDYSGQVDVSMHYLEPNQETTFNQMPGMLFGMRENGNASAMETYGMMAINLFSPSGEELNINENTPATLTFPISNTTPNSPNQIQLWYFDETVGYWKEQGVATKTGATYTTEVTHFSWWNCDIPLGFVNVCFTLLGSNELPNFYFQIVRNATNQIIYSGFTNNLGQECGLFPANENVTIRVYSDCSGSIIHTQQLGPFSTDQALDIILPDLPSDIIETTLTATVNDCSGNPIDNGYMALNRNGVFDVISITDGTLNLPFVFCNSNNNTFDVVFYDLNSNKTSDAITVNFTPITTDLGMINICNDTVGGTFVGDVILENQQEVNIFGLFGYSDIQGRLFIGTSNVASDITDVSPLNALVSVSQQFNIINNTNLVNLEGLQNLTSLEVLYVHNNQSLLNFVGLENLSTAAGLSISENPSMINMEGLQGISSTGSIYVSFNSSLINFEGLNSLTTASGISITNNPSLINFNGLNSLNSTTAHGSYIEDNELITNLEGFDNLTTVYDILEIDGNENLVDLSGIENLTTISGIGVFNIFDNISLSTLNGLDNLSSVTRINITNNAVLSNLSGMNSLNTITSISILDNDSLTSLTGLETVNLNSGAGITIASNNMLTSLNGLEGMTSINSLSIDENPNLMSLSALSNLTTVGSGNLNIFDNDSLTNLVGLENLTSINNGNLFIANNDSLTTLDNLDNLTAVKDVFIGQVLNGGGFPNPLLTDFCALQNLFNSGTYENVSIDNNGYNPTVADIQAGNCSN